MEALNTRSISTDLALAFHAPGSQGVAFAPQPFDARIARHGEHFGARVEGNQEPPAGLHFMCPAGDGRGLPERSQW